MKKKFLITIVAVGILAGCSKKLEQLPQSTTSRDAVFSSEKGLELYSNSFYQILPSANNVHTADMMSDYGARRDAPAFLRDGAYNATSVDNTSASAYALVALGPDWDFDWGQLRNVNYFIVNNNDSRVPADVRNHYMGVAKFFRAFFYFEKVKRYGDVPWINKPLDVNDPDLYKARDSRTLVIDSVLADLDFAAANIRTTNDPSRTLISKWVAYAFKARVCLFEGTFRKYHTQLGLTASANALLTIAATAAKEVMDKSGYKLYEGAGVAGSYRKIFTNPTPVPEEIMLAASQDAALGILHAANWYYTSATTGVRFNFIRSFINTYLNIDGTPFTNNPAYQTMVFKDEVKGRDRRLEQTIRMGSYKRISGTTLIPAPPTFTYSYTGYMPIKWSLDDTYYDTRDLNINAVSIFRYAEVLLNYAEAKAELGTLTDADWALTIGAIRKRAGITGGLTAKPILVDAYLQSTYFPNISDPVILEVRRERGIELTMEGFRFYDLMRWKRGELLTMTWNGMYVPALNTPMDLNEDGINDVLFYQGTAPAAIPGVLFINVSATVSGQPNPQRLSNNTSGEVQWLVTIPRSWQDKKYFYPIPEPNRTVNPKLAQNPGW
ncbi:MAG TPA: RagB/SusD family nutrient uptake outer membrane protein [Chitinophagaceae bacterium]|nr:RagB/SusD family nutrient uptake outer membrane protein [Chitinophagaceae bacterium]